MVIDVFPAWAGVNPRDRIQIIKKYGIPRVSGGEPSSTIAFLYIFSYSPRERGWTLICLDHLKYKKVFPAWAGVNLKLEYLKSYTRSIPRVSGGEPSFF